MKVKQKRGQNRAYMLAFGYFPIKNRPREACFRGKITPSESMELLFLGRAGQSGNAGLTPLDNRGDIIKIARSHFLLV